MSLKPFLLSGISAYLVSMPLLGFGANADDIKKLEELQKSSQHVYVDLSSADLRKYPFTPGKIDLQHANLSRSNLSGVNLSKMNLGGADLSYADLSHAILNEVNLSTANLSHANLTGAQIVHSDLTSANLSCANLDLADLTKSTFNHVTISGASMVNTNTAEIVGYESVVDETVSCS